MSLTILVATLNRGKVREIQEFFSSASITCLGLDVFGQVVPCVEKGMSFEENARQKAAYYSRASSWLTLADDSGLVVDALGGAPGIHSARFISDSATDGERCQEVLRRLGDLPPSRRSARFICVMALALNGEVKEVYEGSVEGQIAHIPAGENGFGYDPIFLLPDLGKTMAQLSSEQKLSISHRGRALEKLEKALAIRIFPGATPEKV